MKAGVAFVSLLLVASSFAEYSLKCTQKELGILWPIYEDSTKYYNCLNIGKAAIMTCNAGTLFTFVYQGCVLPDEYIAPPPLAVLPTDPSTSGEVTTPTPGEVPATNETTTASTTIATEPPFTLPTPQNPGVVVTDSTVSDEPVTDEPVTDEPVTDEPVTDVPVTDAPVTDEPVTDSTTPSTTESTTPSTTESTTESTTPSTTPSTTQSTTLAGPPGPPSPAPTDVPMPATPVPTPPVVDKEPPTPAPTAGSARKS